MAGWLKRPSHQIGQIPVNKGFTNRVKIDAYLEKYCGLGGKEFRYTQDAKDPMPTGILGAGNREAMVRVPTILGKKIGSLRAKTPLTIFPSDTLTWTRCKPQIEKDKISILELLSVRWARTNTQNRGGQFRLCLQPGDHSFPAPCCWLSCVLRPRASNFALYFL